MCIVLVENVPIFAPCPDGKSGLTLFDIALRSYPTHALLQFRIYYV